MVFPTTPTASRKPSEIPQTRRRRSSSSSRMTTISASCAWITTVDCAIRISNASMERRRGSTISSPRSDSGFSRSCALSPGRPCLGLRDRPIRPRDPFRLHPCAPRAGCRGEVLRALSRRLDSRRRAAVGWLGMRSNRAVMSFARLGVFDAPLVRRSQLPTPSAR